MSEKGSSLLELLFLAASLVTFAGIAIPPVIATLDDVRTRAAVRYMTTRIQRTRMDAAARSRNAALHFVPVDSTYAFSMYVDENGNGVRTEDIADGIDRRLGPAERLSDTFPGVEFGVLPNLPPVDPGGSPPGSDPIRLGSSDILSYSATGSSTAGSLYIRGRRHAQYAIRVLGDTGRTRILKFDASSRQWTLP